jgi:hypothetical protein
MPCCEVCDAELPEQSAGRPRRYCSRECKEAAAVWRGIEAVIARARAADDVEFADERAAWLAQVRAGARHGWAGARARVDEVNRRTRRRRRPDDEE